MVHEVKTVVHINNWQKRSHRKFPDAEKDQLVRRLREQNVGPPVAHSQTKDAHVLLERKTGSNRMEVENFNSGKTVENHKCPTKKQGRRCLEKPKKISVARKPKPGLKMVDFLPPLTSAERNIIWRPKKQSSDNSTSISIIWVSFKKNGDIHWDEDEVEIIAGLFGKNCIGIVVPYKVPSRLFAKIKNLDLQAVKDIIKHNKNIFGEGTSCSFDNSLADMPYAEGGEIKNSLLSI